MSAVSALNLDNEEDAKKVSAESLAPLVAKSLKGKKQFCSIVTLDQDNQVFQRLRFDKKQMPGKLHVEDYVFSHCPQLIHLDKRVKTVLIASINSFCLSGNRNDKSRPCCMDALANWHLTRPNIRLILVYKKPYEIDKSLAHTIPFERYLKAYFYSKFPHAELLKWNGEVAHHL